jgi:membrane fusion protein, multidrug efflux system
MPNPTETKPNGHGAGAPPTATSPGAAAPPGAAAHPPLDAPAVATSTRKRSARTAYLILAGLAGAAVAAYFIHGYLTRDEVGTDDAQIDADVVPVAARVGGVVLHMHVADDQPVAAGDVLAEIDPADYQTRLDAAVAEEAAAHAQAEAAHVEADIVATTAPGGVSQARAQVAGSSAAVHAAAAQVAAARAAVTRARTELAKAETDLGRARSLHDQGATTAQQLENAQAGRDAAKAAVDGAQAGLEAARGMQSSAVANVAAAQGRLTQTAPAAQQKEAADKAAQLADAHWDGAKARLAEARLARTYTTIRAPVAGYASKLGAHDGQMVQPGQTLVMIVPKETYVVGNFKETQIARIRPGDAVDVSVDAVPGRTFHGKVVSVAAATGARFSLFPPDNASGNFVKVVQRVPIKIAWTEAVGPELRPGLSAEITVHLR